MDERDIQAELYLMSLDDERESLELKRIQKGDDGRDAQSVKDGLKWYEDLNARRFAGSA